MVFHAKVVENMTPSRISRLTRGDKEEGTFTDVLLGGMSASLSLRSIDGGGLHILARSFFVRSFFKSFPLSELIDLWGTFQIV